MIVALISIRLVIAHISIRVIILQKRECDSGVHINKSGDTEERAIRVVILQRECDSVTLINKSGSIAERTIRVQRAMRVLMAQRNRSAHINKSGNTAKRV